MKIAVLVSGGVDSSLALQLLHEQGHDLTAFYLKIWLEDELSFLGDCPWEQDLEYVKKLCEKLNIPLKVLSLQKEYHDLVVSYTIDQVKIGKTPNPDVLCNRLIKFGAFYDKIDEKFEKVATGHYAKVVKQGDLYVLQKTNDEIKDQTYFLSRLSQKQLSRAIFPIGHLTKSEVRDLASKYDLPSKDRKDSQGICFLGKIKFRDFLKQHLGVKTGDIIQFETKEKLGDHEGFWYHTIGQRKGLGLSGGPWYVVSKDTEKNIVCVSNQYYSEEKRRDSIKVSGCHWISGNCPKNADLQVKIRHGQGVYDAQANFQDDGNNGFIKIGENDQGIAPGQFAVFYDKDVCLGSGVIL